VELWLVITSILTMTPGSYRPSVRVLVGYLREHEGWSLRYAQAVLASFGTSGRLYFRIQKANMLGREVPANRRVGNSSSSTTAQATILIDSYATLSNDMNALRDAIGRMSLLSPKIRVILTKINTESRDPGKPRKMIISQSF